MRRFKCSYLFSEHSDIEFFPLKTKGGEYRVFQYINISNYVTTSVFIKDQMSGLSFDLGKKDILDGKVAFRQSCLACNLIAQSL